MIPPISQNHRLNIKSRTYRRNRNNKFEFDFSFSSFSFSQTVNQNKEFESEYPPRNALLPFPSRPTKLIRTPHVQHQNEQNREFSQRQVSPTGPMTNLLLTSRIRATETNNNRRDNNEVNRLNNSSKIDSVPVNRKDKDSNRMLESRSPSSWSVISNHQISQQEHYLYESSSSSASLRHELIDHRSINICRLIVTDEHLIPSETRFIPAQRYVSQV